MLPLLAALGAEAANLDPAGRLGYWRFNGPDSSDEQGRPPLVASGVAGAPSFDGTALCQSSTNSPAYIRFPCSDPSGAPILNPRQGSIRFLYKPFWASPDTVPRLSRPLPRPGGWIRLFEAGASGVGGYVGSWMLSIDPNGTNLVVHSRDTTGVLHTNLQVRIQWTAADPASPDRTRTGAVSWHEIILNYTPATCALVIDGAVQQDWLTQGLTGQGLPPFNPAASGKPAFAVGSSLTGEHPGQGLFDELETFDRPLSPLRNYAYLARTGFHAAITTKPPSIQLSWFSIGNESRSLLRFEPGSSNPVELATALTGLSYNDTNGLKLGSVYLYRLGGQNLVVALNQPPRDRRGRVIVLVDRTLASALRTEVDQLLADLVGDGWAVARHDVPRHDDNAWKNGPVNPAYRADVAQIKSLVAAEYRAAPEPTSAVLLIGHVTIPYSGVMAEDGHPDHFGAWPSDAYYGDIHGEWTDTTASTPPTAQSPLLRNVPGDGKFDQHLFPQPSRPDAPRTAPGLDLAVGRIDFARLPALRAKSERTLLRQYFEKNHRYRHKQLTFEHNALVGGYFGNPYHVESAVLYHIGNLLAYRLYRPVLSTVLDGEALASGASAVWAIQGGYGDPTALHNSASIEQGIGHPARGHCRPGRIQDQTPDRLLCAQRIVFRRLELHGRQSAASGSGSTRLRPRSTVDPVHRLDGRLDRAGRPARGDAPDDLARERHRPHLQPPGRPDTAALRHRASRPLDRHPCRNVGAPGLERVTRRRRRLPGVPVGAWPERTVRSLEPGSAQDNQLHGLERAIGFPALPGARLSTPDDRLRGVHQHEPRGNGRTAPMNMEVLFPIRSSVVPLPIRVNPCFIRGPPPNPCESVFHPWLPLPIRVNPCFIRGSPSQSV